MRDIGKNIRDLRIEKNLTQDQLAEKLFVTRQTVSNYENGKSRPDIDMIAKISEVLECDVNTVLYGVQDNSKKTEYIKLAVGAVMTAITIALYMYFAPIVMRIKGQYYLASFNFLIGFVLFPLMWLLVGWTVMQLACIAFKTRTPVPKWTKRIKYLLFIMLAAYFTVILIWILPVAIEDYRYLDALRKGVHNVSINTLPNIYSNIGELVLGYILYFLGFRYDLRIPVFLSCGIILWLCGFPKRKKTKAMMMKNQFSRIHRFI
ncbi:MAG: helix-turn-helix transcriptional regulator [Oscillospiraceae bacterium]|nr:helix-turn-helix transcriptional regulator [Oscillospiraceae bacterium]